jgi:tetratricopeptide (TPR) repeat protein
MAYTGPEIEIIRDAVAKVLSSKTFSSSDNLARLLRFCSEKTLAGSSARQDEIACELGYKDFNPTFNPNVRREMGRLRMKLRDYYDEEGLDDDIALSVPKAREKRGYKVEFRFRNREFRESQNPAYLKNVSEARRLWAQRNPQAILKAIQVYELSVADGPGNCAGAQAGLSECYLFLALAGWPPSATLPKAQEWAKKALAIDSEHAVACASLGFVSAVYSWDWELASKLFCKALALKTDSIDVYCWYAGFLVAVGRYREALRYARKAQALEHDPSPVVLGHIGKII